MGGMGEERRGEEIKWRRQEEGRIIYKEIMEREREKKQKVWKRDRIRKTKKKKRNKQ